MKIYRKRQQKYTKVLKTILKFGMYMVNPSKNRHIISEGTVLFFLYIFGLLLWYYGCEITDKKFWKGEFRGSGRSRNATGAVGENRTGGGGTRSGHGDKGGGSAGGHGDDGGGSGGGHGRNGGGGSAVNDAAKGSKETKSGSSSSGGSGGSKVSSSADRGGSSSGGRGGSSTAGGGGISSGGRGGNSSGGPGSSTVGGRDGRISVSGGKAGVGGLGSPRAHHKDNSIKPRIG